MPVRTNRARARSSHRPVGKTQRLEVVSRRQPGPAAALLRLGASAWLACLCLAPPARAEIFLARTDEWTIPAGETSTNENWIAAEAIHIEGACTDDLYALTLRATLAGRFDEDVWLLSRDTISFSGRAKKQVRLAATTIELSGHHSRSCIALGYSISATPESRFQTDLVLAGDTVLFSGQALGDVILAGSRVTVQGRVEGDLYLLSHDATVQPGTRVGGNIYHLGERDLALSRQVELGGETKRISAPWLGGPQTPLSRLLDSLRWLAAAGLSGLLLMTLFPDFTGRSVRTIRRTPARALLVGSLAVLSVPLLILVGLGAATVRPLCLLALAYLGVLFYLARVVVALALGGLFLRRRGVQTFRRAAEAMGTGLLLLYLLGAMPIVGNVVLILTLCFGGGALLSAAIARPAQVEVSVPPVLSRATENSEAPPHNHV